MKKNKVKKKKKKKKKIRNFIFGTIKIIITRSTIYLLIDLSTIAIVIARARFLPLYILFFLNLELLFVKASI